VPVAGIHTVQDRRTTPGRQIGKSQPRRYGPLNRANATNITFHSPVMNTCRPELLAAAHVMDDCARKGVSGDQAIDKVGVSFDAVVAGQELVEFPGEADLARDRLAE
jgi:hypothetical protein